MAVDETAPLARMVSPGLPGVGAHIDDASPRVCVLTLVKQCFTGHKDTANLDLSHCPRKNP